jgi:hypothetical protein
MNTKAPSKGTKYEVDSDTRSYFLQIGPILEAPFDTEEEKNMLINNVHQEMKGHEFGLSVDKRCSKILEKILSFSNYSQIQSFFSRMIKQYPTFFFKKTGFFSLIISFLLNL